MKFNILLIESNYSMRLFLNTFLDGEFNVTAYDSAEDAIEGLNADYLPDLIIQRFDLDKIEEIKTIKENILLRNLPSIMLTQKDKSEQRLAAFKMNATDCVSKPFNPLELVERIENILEMRQAMVKSLAS